MEGTPEAVHSHWASDGTLHRRAVIMIPQNLHKGTDRLGIKEIKPGFKFRDVGGFRALGAFSTAVVVLCTSFVYVVVAAVAQSPQKLGDRIWDIT